MSDGSKFKQMLNRQAGVTSTEVADSDGFDPSGYEPGQAKAFTTTTGKRQPGFALALRHESTRHWIFYHAIRRLKSFTRGTADYLQFTHEELAVTIEGQRLSQLIGLIGEGRLKALFEPDGKPLAAASAGDPVITAVRVTDIEAQADQTVRLVK